VGYFEQSAALSFQSRRSSKNSGSPALRWLRRLNFPKSKSGFASKPTTPFARGVFGVPSMKVRDALFWGYNDLLLSRAISRGQRSAGPDRIAKVVHDSTVIGSLSLSIQNRGRLTASVPGDFKGSYVAV
jgi:hypothetical protein